MMVDSFKRCQLNIKILDPKTGDSCDLSEDDTLDIDINGELYPRVPFEKLAEFCAMKGFILDITSGAISQ